MPSSSSSNKKDLQQQQPLLQVSAQQSRYAIDAVDAPTTKEVLIKDLSISLGKRELLARTTLHLCEGGRYVLVGRNGEGKSSMFPSPCRSAEKGIRLRGFGLADKGESALLKALANKQIPGVAWNQRILLLGQTRQVAADQDGGNVKDFKTGQAETVLQHVIRSDAVREQYSKEAEFLSKALDADDSTGVIKAYRTVSHQRLLRKLDEQISIAERRSGARGKDARKGLIEVEAEIELSKSRLDEDLSKIEPSVMSAETQAAAEILTDVQAALEMMNAAATESRARTVLLGLGFTPDKIDQPILNLSGGWRTRCDLASALFQSCDILLLDEPTNFLDLPSIIWLQDYINTELASTTVLTVTHDRDFADAIGQDLLILRHKVLETFKGNLSTYEREKLKKVKYMSTMKAANERQKKHMEQSVQNNLKAAKKSGDDKKLKQAASRQKRIEERSGLQVSAKGGRFKLNRDLAGYHLSNRAEIEVPDFDPLPKIGFPSMPPDLRFPGALASLEKVSFRYDEKGPLILKDIDFTIHYGERYGLAGLNGSGKSTLVQLLDGQTAPTSGTITRHPRLHIARFNQHVVEDLDVLSAASPEVTALAHLLDFSGGALNDGSARAVLGSLGLSGAAASDVPISLLSGGQKVRLALAKLVYFPPHLLVLDEVTTHLDGETILALIPALKAFEGAILVVTHDRFFMRCVVEGENPAKVSSRAALDAVNDEQDQSEDSDYEEALDKSKGSVFRMFKGGLRKLDGGMDEYEDIATRAAAKLVAKWSKAG